MKRALSIFLVCLTVLSSFSLAINVFAAEGTSFPAETDSFKTTSYYKGTATDKPFFDEVMPEIIANIEENNKHTVTPYYDKMPLANNPENFQGLGHTTYADINGETVTAEAFYRTPNEGLHDPNCGLGLLLYQCIQYKLKYPEADVKVTFASYRTSSSAAVCVIPGSKYYGYMRSLFTTDYDEQGFVRISFMLVEAARMGIEVTAVTQLNSYGKKQYNPSTDSLKTRTQMDFAKYFRDAQSVKCYDKYAEGKKVSDFFTFSKVGWRVNDITIDMQHLKSLAVSHYIATDGTEHKNAVFFSSSNLDDNDYRGANGNNSSQSGVIISDHEALFRITYNYTRLMTRYDSQEGLYELRDVMRRLNMEQYELIVSGREDEIPRDEQILYLGSETDSVFELYMTPFGGGTDMWEPRYNPICKYIDKLQASDDYVEFFWNAYGYGHCNLGETMRRKLEDVFCSRPNPLNKYVVKATNFDSSKIESLKVGSEIGFCSVKSSSGIHSKDLVMSYSENGVRHNVCLLTSCNYYNAAYYYRTNSMLVINEIEDDTPGFYEIFNRRYSYGAISDAFEVNPAKLVLEKGEVFEAVASNTESESLVWTSSDNSVASVVNGKIIAHKTGKATISVTDSVYKDSIALTVVDCIDCYNAKGLTCSENEQYVLTKKHPSMPLTFEAVFSVDADTLEGTTTIMGSDNRYDTSIVFSLNKNGAPRLAIRDTGGYSTQKTYTFSDVNVATGERVHLAISCDFTKGEMYCYVNGELKSTKKGITPPIEFEEKHTAVIGGDLRNGNATHFTGIIESVALFSDVRTAAEISDDAKKGIDAKDENLLCAYDFNYCPEHFIKDLSKNENHLQHIALWQDKEDVPAVGEFDYSFAVIGDTQTMCEKDPEAMADIYDWLLENKDSQKIEYVIGLGDITDDSTDEEWAFALDAISRLDGKIPYVLSRGNHDDWDDFNRLLHNGFYETTVDGMMNEGTISLTDPSQPGLIPKELEDGSIIYVTREEDIPEGGEVTGDLTNSYRCFNVQGTDYLFLTLDFAPDEEMLKWADEVISSHPKHKVIIITHAYMYRDGDPITDGDCYPPTYYKGYEGAQNGDDMWEKCFSKHENVLMVLSGHDPWQHIVYRQDTGEKGNTVTQMLIDPQYVDLSLGSTSTVAMFYFSNDSRTLTVRYYSIEKDMYGSCLSQFTIALYPHSHEYKEVVTTANPQKDGKLSEVCIICGEESSQPIYAPTQIIADSYVFDFDGNVHKPVVTVKDRLGNTLKENEDYTVSYSGDGTSPGDYSFTVTFMGDYSGSITRPFAVNEKPKPLYTLGDTDNDGNITASDARTTLRASVGLETLNEMQKKAADADKDGEIKAADARLILRASVGLERLEY